MVTQTLLPLSLSFFLTTLTPRCCPVQATLEMLLFSQPSPAGDYHYSGKPPTSDPHFHRHLKHMN